jgi:hypothetical protein
MRHLFTLLTALGLCGSLAGCHHFAGKCDCDPGDDPCSFWPGVHGAAIPEPANGHGDSRALSGWSPYGGSGPEPISAPAPKPVEK